MKTENIKIYFNCKLVGFVSEFTLDHSGSISVKLVDGSTRLGELHLIRQEENFLCFYCVEAEN